MEFDWREHRFIVDSFLMCKKEFGSGFYWFCVDKFIRGLALIVLHYSCPKLNLVDIVTKQRHK